MSVIDSTRAGLQNVLAEYLVIRVDYAFVPIGKDSDVSLLGISFKMVFVGMESPCGTCDHENLKKAKTYRVLSQKFVIISARALA